MNFDNDENLDYQLNKVASIVIREKRLEKGYSLEELANKLNNIVTRQSLYRYENNEARMKNNIFKKICLALNENPSDVWEEINNKFLNFVDFDNAELTNLPTETIQIPLLGKIPAGIPLEIIEDKYAVDTVDIPKDWLKGNHKYFALKLEGDSMEPDYLDKDIIIFKQVNDCVSGQDCCIRINGFDATFKRVRKQDNGIMIIPLNENNSSGFVSTFYSKEDIEKMPIEILGVVKQIRRNKWKRSVK